MVSIESLLKQNIPKQLKNYINGAYITPSSSPSLIPVINPYTNQILTHSILPTTEEINYAIDSSKTAQPKWLALKPSERSRILFKAGALLRKHNMALARLETLNTGKCIQETSTVDIISAAQAFEYYAAIAATCHQGKHIPLDYTSNTFAYTCKEPIGLIAAIAAWNYPLQIAAWKTAPALAAGCPVILKPSELTPLTAYFLPTLLQQAGVPDGLFNFLQGGSSIGAALTSHPDINKVSFTGSLSTGRKILSSIHSNKNNTNTNSIKKVSLELGGKSPLIIFQDCDLKNSTSAALLANFYSQGQICSNGTRIFVQREILPEFLSLFIKRARKIRMGDPTQKETQMGPLISAAHKKKVMEMIKTAETQGATVTFCIDGNSIANSNNFVPPTILTDCTDSMTAVQEEIFGPVAAVLPFDTEEEVICRANKTMYGLAGGVFTKDVKRAHRVAKKLECGTVYINCYNSTALEVPFGGYKCSGVGRECGQEGVEEYLQTRSVFVEGSGVLDSPYE